MKINENINIYKITRIAFGCCLAITIASLLNLQNSISAGIITLLSVQNTKKETLTLALQRLVAFGVAILIAYAFFHVIGYNIWAFGLYLVVFICFCYNYRLEAVITICTVLITHFWIAKNMYPLLILNELSILIIGTSVGVILNLFLSRNINQIRQAQEQIETTMRKILYNMADIIENNLSPDLMSKDIILLNKTLQTALIKAYDTLNNTLTSDMRYYVQYVNLRRNQYTILLRIRHSLSKLTYVPEQAYTLTSFLRKICESFHEHNNAKSLLNDWNKIIQMYRQEDLPKTREEFEARAILFQIFNDIEHILLLKKEFVEDLTLEQKKIFWS